MGDNGQMYVPETLLPIYRNEIIPLCDICTPNQYEVELLTGTEVKSISDAWLAMEWFHERGVKTVALSSTDLGPADGLLAFVSHRNSKLQSTIINICYVSYLYYLLQTLTKLVFRSQSPNRVEVWISLVPETSLHPCFLPIAHCHKILRLPSKTPLLHCNRSFSIPFNECHQT